MTTKEINNIPFCFSSHLNMEHEHCTTFNAEYKGHKFGMCRHSPYKNGVPKGKPYVHYMVDGKVFKTKEKFLQHCETL